MEFSLIKFKNSGWLNKVMLFVFVPLVFFFIVLTYYRVYQILTGKCKYCGKVLEDKLIKAYFSSFIFWKKPNLVCKDCKINQKKNLNNVHQPQNFSNYW